MKGTLVYNMKLEKKKRQRVTLFRLNWEHVRGAAQIFCCFTRAVNDGESTACIDFGLQIYLSQWVNSQIGNGSGLVAKSCLALATS